MEWPDLVLACDAGKSIREAGVRWKGAAKGYPIVENMRIDGELTSSCWLGMSEEKRRDDSSVDFAS
jgi:hypothetical protein